VVLIICKNVLGSRLKVMTVKQFRLQNEMFLANFLANLVAVFGVNGLMRTAGAIPSSNLSHYAIPYCDETGGDYYDFLSFGDPQNPKIGVAIGDVSVGTDGVWEARNDKGEMLGKESILDVIRQHANKDADQILAAVFATVKHHIGGRKIEDDITSMVIKRLNVG